MWRQAGQAHEQKKGREIKNTWVTNSSEGARVHILIPAVSACLLSGLAALALDVQDHQEGAWDERAEEDGQVGRERHLQTGHREDRESSQSGLDHHLRRGLCAADDRSGVHVTFLGLRVRAIRKRT